MIEYRKEYFADARADGLTEVGVMRQRSDVLGHVTGKTQYYADRNFPGLLHLKYSEQERLGLQLIFVSRIDRGD